jgi:hypothetical protein
MLPLISVLYPTDTRFSYVCAQAYGALGTVGSPVPASSFLSPMHAYPPVMPAISPGAYSLPDKLRMKASSLPPSSSWIAGWSFGAEGGGDGGYSAFHFPPPAAFGGHSYFGEQQMHSMAANGAVMGGVDVSSLEGVDMLHPQAAAAYMADHYAHLPPPPHLHHQHLQHPQYSHYNAPQ